MAIIKKGGGSSHQSSKKQIIKISPYENPENVMELMAKICSAQPSAETDIYWGIINEAYNKEVNGISLYNYLSENRGNLFNPDFMHDLNDFCSSLAISLTTRENTEHTQIVVAGGFSSGKSSFLNKLTKSANLLPTGVEPVSVVKTYLYCSSNNKSVSVKGVNLKNVLVDLNPGVLQAIQHAKQSNIYLGSVLEKLFVEIPSQELNGLVFIDTPGYNNSDKANESNGKTDKETALEALGEGNVLFWLVDCERGTTVTADLDMIKSFQGPKVFIFNKADKKGFEESKIIVENAAVTLYKEFSKDEIIDIIAFSTLENKIYYSKNDKSLEGIIEEVKKSGNGTNDINVYSRAIEILFEDEITESNNTIKKIEQDYQELVKKKNNSQKLYQDAKEYKDSIVERLNETLIKGYNELMGIADKLTDSSKYAIDSFSDFYDGVIDFETNDHWGQSDILDRAIKEGTNSFNRALKIHSDAIQYKYYLEEHRKNIVKQVEDEENIIVGVLKEYYNNDSETCQSALERKESMKGIINDMEAYRDLFMSALHMGIKEYQRQNKATNMDDDEYKIPNVFETIKNDDYKAFLHSFEEGVDMAVCNADGYNPLTLAVKSGNNMMVQFLLKHGADPSLKDNRGYNAFHTAVENQFQDICKILIDVDSDLVNTTTSLGETVLQLANKQTFSKWIEREIENAI